MRAVGEFFQRLRNVHLFFWRLSFHYFDAIPVFLAILAALGVDAGIKQTVQSGMFQFILAVLCFAYCYLRKVFQANYVNISNNMICLSLSISFLASVFSFVLLGIMSIAPLGATIGLIIGGFNEDLKDWFPWDSEYSWSGILFLVSYLFICINTVHVEGSKAYPRKEELVHLVVSFFISFMACLATVTPVIATISM